MRTLANIEKIIHKWVAEQPSINLAILFGSFAKGTQTASSDIDLAIQLDKAMTTEDKLLFLQSLGELFDRNIDLIDLNTVGEPLLNQIIRYGKLLKGDKQDHIDLKIKNVNMMQDFTPYIERTLKERRNRLLHG